MPVLMDLPDELLVRIFSLSIETARDVSMLLQTCHRFHDICSDPNTEFVWHLVAEREYGKDVLKATRPHYDSYKELLQDANVRGGAMPTLKNLEPCMWRQNLPTRYYCCILECVQWDRERNKFHFYLDARGEVDLRHPERSSMCGRSLNECSVQTVRGDWTSSLEQEVPSHHRGCLTIDAMGDAGNFTFCYANLMHRDNADYSTVKLFSIQEGESLKDIFIPGDGKSHYTLRGAPHLEQGDNRQQWEAVVNPKVFQRHRKLIGRRPEWFV